LRLQLPFMLLQHPFRRFKGFEHCFGAADGLAFGHHPRNPRAKPTDKDFTSPHMAGGSKQLDLHVIQ
jgi:hypothetical protein